MRLEGCPCRSGAHLGASVPEEGEKDIHAGKRAAGATGNSLCTGN